MARKKKNKKECAKCKNEYVLDNFYSTDNVLFPDGGLHICKKCVYDTIDEHGLPALKGFLKIIDKPFKKEVWDGNYKQYIRNIMLRQYRNQTYDDSQFLKLKLLIKNLKACWIN